MSTTSNHNVNDEVPIFMNDDSDLKVRESHKTKIALVYGTIPSIEEIEQYAVFSETCEFTLVTAESIAEYMKEMCFFKGLNIASLPDHDENPSFLPGLEKALAGFDVVIIKERVGVYAYQAVKAKWVHDFKLYVVVDNVTPFPGEDIPQMKTIREEVTASADGIIVQSKLVQNMLTTVEKVADDRILYITPRVETRKNASAKARSKALENLKLSDRDFVISAVGQIEWEEGLLDIIHALGHVHDREGDYCNVKLLIYGVGSFDRDIVKRAEALGVRHAIRIVEPSRAATEAVLAASNLMFASAVQSRDRLEGDPFRILLGIANGIPVLSGRTPLVEEILGKHRIDFCVGSPRSIADAIVRSKEAKGLLGNIKTKNLHTVEQHFNKELHLEDFNVLLEHAGQQRQDDKAIATMKQVSEVEKMVHNKQYVDAIALVEKIFTNDDLQNHHRANLYRLIGDSFAKLQDNASAKEAYNYALELDPFLAKAYLGLGAVKLGESNYNGSILDFQKAISYAPQDDMANLGLGLSFQGLGEPDEARNWMVSALKSNPTNEMALFSLVRLSNETEVFEGCELALKKYLSLNPSHPDMSYTLAGVLYRQGKFNEAMLLCEDVLKQIPTHEQFHALYEMILDETKADLKPGKSKLG